MSQLGLRTTVTLQPDILSMNAVMMVTDQEIVLFITTNHHMAVLHQLRMPILVS